LPLVRILYPSRVQDCSIPVGNWLVGGWFDYKHEARRQMGRWITLSVIGGVGLSVKLL